MALLRPRQQFGSNSQSPHSQPGPPSSIMSFLATVEGGPPTPPYGATATTPATSTMTTSPTTPTTLKSTTSGRVESSSTQAPSADGSSTSTVPSSTASSAASPTATSPTNTPSVATGAAASSGTGLAGNVPSATTTLGGNGASGSSSSSFSASTTSGTLITSDHVKCSSLSCNPGKAAAIFVPIAVVLALLALCVVCFCGRRKGRARLGQGLAFFSHGAEANYMSAAGSSAGNSRAPSMREAGSSAGPLAAAGAGLGVAGAAGLAAARGRPHQPHDHDFGLGFVPDMVSRSSSNAECAPPPYAPADSTSRSAVTAPAPAHTVADPFADTPNPFADDADDNTSLLSGDTAVGAARGGSRRSQRDNASIVSSLQDMDEAGSIREAHVANVSRAPSGSGAQSRPREFS